MGGVQRLGTGMDGAARRVVRRVQGLWMGVRWVDGDGLGGVEGRVGRLVVLRRRRGRAGQKGWERGSRPVMLGLGSAVQGEGEWRVGCKERKRVDAREGGAGGRVGCALCRVCLVCCLLFIIILYKHHITNYEFVSFGSASVCGGVPRRAACVRWLARTVGVSPELQLGKRFQFNSMLL